MYSNETERANQDIYDDVKLKKNNFVLHGLYKHISALKGLNKVKKPPDTSWQHTCLLLR